METQDLYEYVYSHLLKCSDKLYLAGFDNSLLYREIKCLINFIDDILR